MAGGHIFLEPILQNTVVAPINSINAAIEPLPGKIDEQIAALVNVSKLVGSSASNLNIVAGTDNKFQNESVQYYFDHWTVNYFVPISTPAFFTTAITNGRCNLHIPAFVLDVFSDIGRNFNITYLIDDVTTSTAVRVLTKTAYNATVSQSGTTVNVPEVIEPFSVVAGHKYQFKFNWTSAGNSVWLRNKILPEDNRIWIEYNFANPVTEGAFTL